jgi:hypothetical protein
MRKRNAMEFKRVDPEDQVNRLRHKRAVMRPRQFSGEVQNRLFSKA